MRINQEIRAPKVRVIGPDGQQLGIVSILEALKLAEEAKQDLIEIAPNASPPVCKIINYGKYCYEQTKREKLQRKGQHKVKVKEVKLKPNTDEHDFEFKLKHAREFIQKGNKVKISCTFKGREMLYPELGEKIVIKMSKALEDVACVEMPLKKMTGRSLITVMAPGGKKSEG